MFKHLGDPKLQQTVAGRGRGPSPQHVSAPPATSTRVTSVLGFNPAIQCQFPVFYEIPVFAVNGSHHHGHHGPIPICFPTPPMGTGPAGNKNLGLREIQKCFGHGSQGHVPLSYPPSPHFFDQGQGQGQGQIPVFQLPHCSGPGALGHHHHPSVPHQAQPPKPPSLQEMIRDSDMEEKEVAAKRFFLNNARMDSILSEVIVPSGEGIVNQTRVDNLKRQSSYLVEQYEKELKEIEQAHLDHEAKKRRLLRGQIETAHQLKKYKVKIQDHHVQALADRFYLKKKEKIVEKQTQASRTEAWVNIWNWAEETASKTQRSQDEHSFLTSVITGGGSINITAAAAAVGASQEHVNEASAPGVDFSQDEIGDQKSNFIDDSPKEVEVYPVEQHVQVQEPQEAKEGDEYESELVIVYEGPSTDQGDGDEDLAETEN